MTRQFLSQARQAGISKAVDAQGQSLVVDHGTAGDFAAFAAQARQSANRHSSAAMSFYVKADSAIASPFAPPQVD